MPQRFLRPGITTSERFNKLDWMAQSFYLRLITLVDDYGRFEANPMLLKSLAFPFNPDITCEQLLSMCDQLHAGDMAVFYTVDGKKYLQLNRWQERARSASKFPACSDITCEQLLSSDSKCLSPSSSPPSSSSPGTAPCKKLSASEAISFEKELGRVTKELNGRTPADASGPNTRKRIEALIARQRELREKLGVVA